MNTRATTNGTWLAGAGSLATALLLVWLVTAGDAAAGSRAVRTDADGVKLLRDAAAAARRTSFEGTQFITAWSRKSATTSLVDVAHVPGQGTYMKVQGTTTEQGGTMFEADEQPTRGGLTGYTPKMLDLLIRNYSVVRAGEGSVCGRVASIVEARRQNGSAAGRFWIDRKTGLMLRRELLDEQGRQINITSFFDLRLTRPNMGKARVPQTVAAEPWVHQLVDTDLGALRRDGWTLPQSLPGNLTLSEARQSDTGPVVHVTYTDGLSAVSVFIQPGQLDEAAIARWPKVSTGGRTIYQRDTVQQRAVWSSRGYVYTVVADAPSATVDAAVAALPHGEAGIWTRVGRGLARLASWLNPFG